ncbi:MAG: carbohydrate ABC transporter permease, partial [Omnitrophica WOR_2 bacterium]
MARTLDEIQHREQQKNSLSSARFRQRYLGPILRYGLVIILSVLFLLPYYTILRNALMTQPDILSFQWKWLPDPIHLENLTNLFADPLVPMSIGLKNSLIMATLTTLGQLLLASMAGYALARIPFRLSNQLLYLILIPLMIPSAVTFIPSYVLVASLGWVNTLQGLIVPGLFSVFAVFMFRQFYLDFPKEIEEAGRVDGLSYFGIYRYLLLPNSLGIIMSLGVLAFLGSWNSFLWPLVIGQDRSSWTVQ